MTDELLVLPEDLRSELKDPMGPVYTDAEALLSEAGRPIVAVGDIVTYHLVEAGTIPDVALIDDRTERSAVDPTVRDAIGGFDRQIDVANPAATVSESLVEAILAGLETEETTLIFVDGEEDLGALPAILALPDEGSLVYGQPGEGMVLVDPAESAETVRDLLSRMDGDIDAAISLLDAADR